jgi:hypothetical protein
MKPTLPVIPAKAGIHAFQRVRQMPKDWIPAFAGMTEGAAFLLRHLWKAPS